MAGFVLNIVSEQSLGLPASIPSNIGDTALYGQFRQMLQQASSESTDLTKSYLASGTGNNSGKDLPIDLSFSEQSLAADSDILSDVSEVSEVSDVSEVSGIDLNAELIGEPVKPEIILVSKPGLSPDKLISIDSQPSSNNPIKAQNISGIDTIDNLKSSINKTALQGDIVKNSDSAQKGLLTDTSESAQSHHSKSKQQSNQLLDSVVKTVEKSPLPESIRQTLAEQPTKPKTEEGLQHNKLQDMKLSELMTKGVLSDEEDYSEMLKPENTKFSRPLSKSDQADSPAKTDISQMVTQLKNSKSFHKTVTASNSSQNAISVSEPDSTSQINKLIMTTNTEMTTSQTKAPQNIIANSAIQSGLSLKRNFSPNLAARIQWVYQQAISSAEILMDPPELGPLSVKITKNNGETNVLFQVSNPSTKEAIEENLAKLKELLAEQGINLGDTQVEQQQKNDKNENMNEKIAADSSAETEQQDEQQIVRVQQGLLDTYI